MALPQNDTVGDRYDLGLLPQQQPTLVQLMRRKLELLQALKDKMTGGVMPHAPANSTAGQAGVRAGLERFTNAITGIPDLAATSLLSIPNKAINDVKNFANLPEILGYPRTEQGPLPGIGEKVIPGMPDAASVFAGAQRLGEGAAALKTGDFGQFRPDPREQQQLTSEAMALEHPVATAVGNIAGDVATLGTVRSPVARARSLQEMSAMETKAALEAAHNAAIQAGTLKGFRSAPTLTDAVKSATADSRGFNMLMNRAGRSAEAGLEGAILGILQDGDPQELAAYSAGGQAAGSVLLGGLTGLFSGGPLKVGTKLAISAVSVGAMLQTLKSMTPGGQDFSLESIESGFNKVGLGIAAGLMAGISGAGRFPIKALPAISDAITSVPRAATISVLNDALNDTRTEKVIQRISTEPDYFGPTAARRLERAFRNPNISISGVIDDLMESKSFRDKYEALEKKP